MTEIIFLYWFIDASTNYHYLSKFSLQIAIWNLSMATSLLVLPWTIAGGFLMSSLPQCNILFYTLIAFNVAGTMGIIVLVI